MTSLALRRPGRLLAAILACLFVAPTISLAARKKHKMPSVAKIDALVQDHFSQLKGYRKGDLISRDDVSALMTQLEKKGWRGATKLPLLEEMLPANHLLVREMRTTKGKAFMRKTASYRLIFDRLDRIGKMTGGQRLIHDLARLPDGHRYAKWKVHQGAPSMEEFLPKGRSGKSPQVKNLRRPTGRIYTEEQFVEALHQARTAAKKK